MKRLGAKNLSSNEIKVKKIKTFVKKINRESIFLSNMVLRELAVKKGRAMGYSSWIELRDLRKKQMKKQ